MAAAWIPCFRGAGPDHRQVPGSGPVVCQEHNPERQRCVMTRIIAPEAYKQEREMTWGEEGEDGPLAP